MVNSAGLSAVPASSISTGVNQFQQAPARAERPGRGGTGPFLVPVPAADLRVSVDLESALLPRSARVESGTFELTAASSRAVVIASLVRARSQLTLSVGGHPASAVMLSAHEGGVLLGLDAVSSNGMCTVRCDLYDVPFLLTGHLQMLEPDLVVGNENAAIRPRAALSALRVHTLDGRRGTRIPLAKGQGTLRWARVVEGSPRVVHSSLVDLAPDGASIELSPSDPAPPNESFVGELQLGSVKIPLLASLRRRVNGRDNALVGLHLEAGRDKHKLVELYMRGRFPGLVPRYEVEGEKLGKLLGDSGYLKLREGEGPSPAWHRYRSPHSLDFVYQARDGSPIGHVSITRSYRRSWLMHQLATLSGHAESGLCRRALYDLGSCAPTAFDGEQACAVAYFNRKLRWHQLFFEEFVQWLNDDRLGTIAVFDRFERGPGAALAGRPAHGFGYRVERLGEDDLLPAVALVRAQLPALAADALDINPQDLQSSSLNGDKERTRSVFVLRGEQGLLGVALCEAGLSSASLFNIFNLAQFYFCTGSGRPSVEAQLALLAAVRGFYEQQGTSSPLIVAPPGTFAAAEEPGTSLAESMGCVVISGVGLRQWEHYCRLQMGRLYQRKTALRNTRGGANDHYVS